MLVHTEAQLHLTRSFYMPWKLFRSDKKFFHLHFATQDRSISSFVNDWSTHDIALPWWGTNCWYNAHCDARGRYSRRYRQHSFFVLPRQLLSSSFISVRCESCTSSLGNLRWNSLPLWHPVSFILSAFPISSLALWQIYFTRHDIW